jgi:hypothetical protein
MAYNNAPHHKILDNHRCSLYGKCGLSDCGKERICSVYGLLDPGMYDIFYVGSSTTPSRRFYQHMSDNRTHNIRSSWTQAILQDGLFPIPIIIYEFNSDCRKYSASIEIQIADQLREQGHTALCDDSTAVFGSIYHKYGPLPFHMECSIAESWINEYLAAMRRNVETYSILRSMFIG